MGLLEFDLTCELWREYDFGGRTYRIEYPVKLFLSTSRTTHRVLDKDGVIHCLPAPGREGCVLRWYNIDSSKPCNF